MSTCGCGRNLCEYSIFFLFFKGLCDSESGEERSPVYIYAQSKASSTYASSRIFLEKTLASIEAKSNPY